MEKNKRILLVDDEEVITFGFSMVLKEPGVDVDCVHTLEDAQACISTKNYDAAIVDLRLSNSTDIEGFSCIRLLRNANTACKILVLTAYGGNDFREQTKVLGVDMFFEKPVEPEVLRNVLKKYGIYNN